MWSGVSKSGSPTESEITSLPCAFRSRAFCVMTIVADGFTRDSVSDRKPIGNFSGRDARSSPMRARRTLVAGAALAPAGVLAQGFPARVIRIVVPYPAGGPVDALARLLTPELGALSQSAIVENVGGGAGAIGARQVAKAEPDGHTLVLSTNQTHATNYILLKDPGYEAKDFAAVAGLADLQHVLVVRNDLAARSVAELVAHAKANPGKLNYGSTGNGSASHLAMELFKVKTGADLVHVPFRGAAPM